MSHAPPGRHFRVVSGPSSDVVPRVFRPSLRCSSSAGSGPLPTPSSACSAAVTPVPLPAVSTRAADASGYKGLGPCVRRAEVAVLGLGLFGRNASESARPTEVRLYGRLTSQGTPCGIQAGRQTHFGGHQAGPDNSGRIISPIPMRNPNHCVSQWPGTRMGRGV
jgi:hypothetical protein